MNDRIGWMTMFSVVLHLAVLWVLPGPSFNAQKPEIKTVSIQLEESIRPQSPREPSRPNEADPRLSDNPVRPKKPRKSTSSTPPPSRGAPPRSSESEASSTAGSQDPPPSDRGSDNPDASLNTTAPDAPAPGQRGTNDGGEQSATESTGNSPYDMLEKESGIGMNRSGPSVQRETRTDRRTSETALDESIKKYRIVRTERTVDTDQQRVILREPGGEANDTRSLDVPVMNISRDQATSAPVDPASDGRVPEARPNKTTRRVLENPVPEAPEWLEKTGQDVRIILRYVIDPEGNVTSVTVLNSSGYPRLDALVTGKLKHWKFEPGERSERRLVVFRFNLKTR